jgi:hypothetical protein
MPTLASVFSSTVFRGLAMRDERPHVRTRLAALTNIPLLKDATVGDAFDAAYRLLVRDYRSEYTFKNELVSKIIFGRHSPATATALIEQPMGSSEADLLVLNGTSTVYEIKTDFDSYSRLGSQLADYSQYADLVNVVTSENRATAMEGMLPDHVGLMAWRRSGALHVVRPPKSNLETLESGRIFELLRTHEALAALSQHVGYRVDVPRGHLRQRLNEIFARLDVVDAHRLVVRQLRSRKSSARSLAGVPWFPPSLRAAAYGTELSQVGTQRVLERLSAPFAIMTA